MHTDYIPSQKPEFLFSLPFNPKLRNGPVSQTLTSSLSNVVCWCTTRVHFFSTLYDTSTNNSFLGHVLLIPLPHFSHPRDERC